MTIEAGQNLLHYRLVEKIGEGGMGVVWKAVDTSLDREVAIKILPDAFAEDPERLARFEREAKLLASLNHANIATIHGLEQDAGAHFLAMELVEGEDLEQRIAREPVPLERAVEIATQVAQALARAAREPVQAPRQREQARARALPQQGALAPQGLVQQAPAAVPPGDASPRRSTTPGSRHPSSPW